MDFKDSKTQKIALAVLAFFIVAYFWYSRLYVPYDSKIELKSQEFETITTNLRNVELKAKSLDALQQEYTDLMKRYHEIEALLPEVKQIPSLLVQLHTASSLTGTRITRVQPRAIRPEDFYNVASFDIEMTGTYHDFGGFIGYVANFPFIANVSGVDVNAMKLMVNKPAKDEKTGLTDLSKKETVTAKFSLSTYFVKESERLSELVL
ncbi:MAG TPA: type 4a pilus biogenesis protein PilO [candidate division Zixibacteria bacterium]|nr:type 4a pilus biogenesis protein PilO [candidate division Zixibacteria bacterium]MDD4916890.1 type 4a pilus biogenesis protein PilO [candidate division Zixibacteria bacterium]MDM7974326.1 type 4a pilus biogenesis protein PilO [candidate division Zixibacteria bacterium]HOD65331.1 type 4a pilus biogenesis protein PilO [candidate division Zixibacteria bacterium]HPI32667.1 type 4a pilus biogenesis protein PilO [candidate division Zixibacteria bacterium]